MFNFQEKANFIWSIAELLRGDYKQAEYGKVILPLVVLRRLDCVLLPTKEDVLAKVDELKKLNLKNIAPVISPITGQNFYNTSKFNFLKLKDEPNNIAANLINYIHGFSDNAREIIDYFKFEEQIAKLDESNLLYQIICKFCEIDLHPDKVSGTEVGYIFEELIRRFSELSNETAGEHFTPREVIRLMVNILFLEDRDILCTKGIVKTLYDPACGSGGMLSVAQEYVYEFNSDARLEVFGQELNAESYAICKADMLLKGQNPNNIKYGNSFTNDGLSDEKFDYLLSNPPFGVEWKKVEKEIKDEYDKLGYGGRFGAGLPRISDGSLLFLQHMISKMKRNGEGSRIAIVFNGSPMFTGAADSGESNIRKWIIENDMLEAVIAMPDQLFYNTGISTYVWVVSSKKGERRKGKIQLINAVDFYEKMRKSLGNKRNIISQESIDQITVIYGDFDNKDNRDYCKIFDNDDFGYNRITVERPLRLNFQITEERINNVTFVKALEANKDKIIKALKSNVSDTVYKNRPEFIKVLKGFFKNTDITYNAALEKALLTGLSEKDETADICLDSKGNPEPDADLRDYENVPLKQDIDKYFDRKVKPHVPDAWIDYDKTKVGYEIPLTRHFYKYQQLRPLEEIDAEIKTLESEILELLQGVSA